jgi:GNAT superfamily N-acetyltransferase
MTKSPTLTIRKAEPTDLDSLEELRAEAVTWLASKGLDQWQPGQPRVPTRKTTAAAIARGACYLAYDQDNEVVGTITVDDRADPEFWTPDERAERALYVHRMMVPRKAAGIGIGSRLLQWAYSRAAVTGCRWLRLDAWKTNTVLHQYYLSQGFSPVRTIDLAHRGSGSLFQCSVTNHERGASHDTSG